MANDSDPRFDDPDWVDNILARARERAQQSPPAPGSDRAQQSPPAPAPERARPMNPPPALRREQLLAAPPDDTPASDAALDDASTPRGRAEIAGVAWAKGAPVSPPAQPAPDVARAARVEPPGLNQPDANLGVASTAIDSRTSDDTDEAADAGDAADADDAGENKGLRNSLEWLAVAAGAVIVALLIRAFLIQAFYIPSESMVPTLHEKDRIVVNKLSYKLHDVHRGDLIVFRRPPTMPQSEAHDLIKRVIALPGETVELRGNDIYIDDRKLTEPYLPDGTITTNLGWVQGCANPSSDRTRCTIPAGHFLVMGDNRQRSFDGRFFGPISEDLIVGRAFLRVWPLGKIDFL